MLKIKIVFGLFILALFYFVFGSAAEAANISFNNDVQLNLTGAGTPIYISTSSAADSWTEMATSVDASIPVGSTFTLATGTASLLAITPSLDTVWLGFDVANFTSGYITQWDASSTSATSQATFSIRAPVAGQRYKITVGGGSSYHTANSSGLISYVYADGFSTSNKTFVITESPVSSSGTGGGGGGGGSVALIPSPSPSPTPSPTVSPSPSPTISPSPVPIAPAAPMPISITSVPAGFAFAGNLKLNQNLQDIKYLQIILNSDPDTKIANSGAGSSGFETTRFGALTRAAVIRFQEKYASEILTPVGLAKGTGIVGLSTRAKLNSLLETVTAAVPSPTPSQTAITGIPSNFNFAVNLKSNQNSEDIKYLQVILNSDPDTRIAEVGAGSSGFETTRFGALTRAAVIRFQEKYASEILTPVGLTKGTGIVGSATRAKINTLIGK